MVAGAVVLVVGGFALSRDYGVQSIPPPPDLEEIATPTTSVTTNPTVSATNPEISDSIDWDTFNWMSEIADVAITSDGWLYAVAPAGVAWQGTVGDWELTDIGALPVGSGGDDGLPRTISHVAAAGPETTMEGFLWVAGFAMSHIDDEEFGGVIDGWEPGGRVLWWVARYHCPVCGEWTVWTSDEIPELLGGVGDLVVSPDGIVYASVGDDLLMRFDGQQWTSFEVPLPMGSVSVSYPWSSSLAVGDDGVLWAGFNYDNGGILSFDGTRFTRFTTEDGLPSGEELRVSAGGDGTIWAATERSGVASFDGTTWTSYTTDDGLLSNQAVIAAGSDGTVWAVHLDDPPYGYSRFDGSGWTTYPSDFEVGGYRAEVDPNGTLWTISDEGLISFDGITRTVHPSPFRPPGLVAGGYETDEFAGGLGTPNDLAFDPTGDLIVSETEAEQVRRIEILPDGSAGATTVVASGIADAEGLAVGHDGALYVSSSRQVYRIADGVVAPFAEGFNDPEGLAIDRHGDLYVADDAVSGIRISKVEVRADGTAAQPTEVVVVPGGTAADIDFGPSGDLFVANGLGAVWEIEFADDGSVDDSYLLASFPESPRTLEFDADGTLYVGTERSDGWSTTGSVWSMKPGGSPTLFAGGFSHVEGLAFDQSGRLYISNVGANQILRVGPPIGTITISIDGWEGVEGYRLLAVVSEEDYELVGGAFWTMIDSDPYSTTDVIHPPFDGEDPPGVEYETWGEGAYLWDETARLKPGIYQITFWANPGELAPYGSHIPSLPIERECQVTVEVTAGHNTEVVISDIPIAGDGGECQRATDDTSVRLLTFTPVRWGIIPADWGSGVHTVLMEANVRPLTANLVEGVSGRLIWDETVVDLCAIGTEQEGGGLLHLGDTFQTTEGCGTNPTAMRDAFDEFGLPEKGCLTATVDGVDYEYCAPLPPAGDGSVGSEPGTITVVLDSLEGLQGLNVDAWVSLPVPRRHGNVPRRFPHPVMTLGESMPARSRNALFLSAMGPSSIMPRIGSSTRPQARVLAASSLPRAPQPVSESFHDSMPRCFTYAYRSDVVSVYSAQA
jgi:glucose/arabinose dehydrogenase